MSTPGDASSAAPDDHRAATEPADGVPDRATRPAAARPTMRLRRQALRSRSLNRDLGSVVEIPRAWPLGSVSWQGLQRATATVADGLRNLPLRRSRVPVRMQQRIVECGPAALSMVLAYHGIDVAVPALVEATRSGRDGVSARSMLETARRYGLSGRGVLTPLDAVRSLPPASILFWNFQHFVVLERVTRDAVYIVDPAFGRRRLTWQAFGESFTGVALEFQGPLAGSRRPATAAGTSNPSPWRHLGMFFPRGRAAAAIVGTSLALLPFGPLLAVAMAYVVAQATTAGLPHVPSMWVLLLLVALAGFLALQLSRSLAVLALQTLVDQRTTVGILRHLLSLPYGYFIERSPGDLVLRVRTSTTVRQTMTSSAVSAVFDGGLILLYSTLLLLLDRFLAGVVVVLATLQVIILLTAWRRQEYRTAELLECQGRAQSQLTELVDGAGTLKATGLEDRAIERWSHTLAEECNARTRSRRSLSFSIGLSVTLQYAAPLIVLLVGAHRAGSGAVTVGVVIGFTALASGVFVPLSNMVQVGLQTSGLGATLARLDDILDTAPESSGQEPTTVDEVTGRLELRNVDFAYPGSATLLRDISLVVPEGAFAVVLGPSGCGKSTLAMLLTGLYLPTGGTVLVDGRDLTTVDRPSLRAAIGYVNQDSRLFSGTIRDNIAWGAHDVTDADIQRAAELAAIHTDIAAMPMGYDTLLGAGGAGLSGGQRQRVALARALVREPHILLLDEATSAMDPELERTVMSNLRGLACTLVVIAHRLTAIETADTVVVMDRGRIVQQGSHAQLSAQHGLYTTIGVSA